VQAARLRTALIVVLTAVTALAALAVAAPMSAASPPLSSGYFSVQPDLRLCPTPTCGGVFVSLLNRRLTRCPDGAQRETCHATDVDWSALGLNAEDASVLEQAVLAGRGLVRGDLRPGESIPGFGDLGVLVVTEGWIAASGRRPRGSFYRLSDNGTVCVTTPCFSLLEALLNTARRRTVSDLDLSRVGARAATVEAAWQQLRTDSILVAGRNVERPDAGPAGRGVALVATQIYLRVPPSRR
jgi:hypothetical protein